MLIAVEPQKDSEETEVLSVEIAALSCGCEQVYFKAMGTDRWIGVCVYHRKLYWLQPIVDC